MYLGGAIALNSAWVLGLFPAAITLIILGAILPEERYLEQKCGQEYLATSPKSDGDSRLGAGSPTQ